MPRKYPIDAYLGLVRSGTAEKHTLFATFRDLRAFPYWYTYMLQPFVWPTGCIRQSLARAAYYSSRTKAFDTSKSSRDQSRSKSHVIAEESHWSNP